MSDWNDIDLVQPQADFEVLVAVDDDVYMAGYREIDEGDYYFTGSNLEIIDGVKYWMDVPKPPEW